MTRSARSRPPGPRMRRPAAIALALSAAAIVSVLTAGAGALAAQRGPATNYRAATVPAAASGRAVSAKGLAKHHYSLAASAFAPDGLHDVTEDYFNEWDPAALSNQNAGRCFNAGLSLPAGATLLSVRVYYTGGSNAMFFELSRQDLVDHTDADLLSFDTAVLSTPEYTSVTEPVAAADSLVNLNGYAYTAGVCPVGSTTFSGLTVTYTQPKG